MASVQFRVEGAAELRRALKQLGNAGLTKTLAKANLKAAQQVAAASREEAPKRTGLMASTITASATTKTGMVNVGQTGAGRTGIYTPIVYFGNPRRHMSANKFIPRAFDRVQGPVIDTYSVEIQALAKRLGFR